MSYSNKYKPNPSNPTIDWIDSIPKIIDNNGCWISTIWKSSDDRGYIRISINDKLVYLHRVSMCLFYNIDYSNYKIETRHNSTCSKSCFNYHHLKPGSSSDNENDKIRKDKCPKCGWNYITRKDKTRYCPECNRKRRRIKK